MSARLILTSFDSDRALVDAVLAGASGFILKQIRSNELIETIRGVAAGRRISTMPRCVWRCAGCVTARRGASTI